jgi:uncharacterized membrane protein YwzB
MVEPENINNRPVMFGMFVLDIIFLYCTGMGFWSIVFWAIDGNVKINSPKIIESAHMVVLPLILAYALFYFIDKYLRRSGKN